MITTAAPSGEFVDFLNNRKRSYMTPDEVLAHLATEELDEDFLATFHEHHGPHIRDEFELFWVNLQPFLISRGYRLRPRYQPDWKPSWDTNSKSPRFKEDMLKHGVTLIDAVRTSDNQKVVLKKVRTFTYEIPVAQLLSSPAMRADPRNHTVPLLDIIPLPADDDWALLVMPMLLEFQRLPFRKIGEFCETAIQYLEALEFMHEHNIVHRDVCMTNLMMDTTKVIPKGFHFVKWYTHDGCDWQHFEWKDRWSVKPVQYYLIDFGISLPLPSKDVLTWGVWGRERSVPEMSHTAHYNPFKVDVYQLGRVFLEMIDEYHGLSRIFLPLAKHMTQPNPKDRSTASEALKMCRNSISKLSRWTLSRRIWPKNDDPEYGCSSIDHLIIRFFGWNPANA